MLNDQVEQMALAKSSIAIDSLDLVSAPARANPGGCLRSGVMGSDA